MSRANGLSPIDKAISQRERIDRAEEVRADYLIEPVGCQAYVVMHPDEPDRCYLVDMIARSCSCPDWECFCRGEEMDCKHVAAIAPIWSEETGLKFLPAPIYHAVHDDTPVEVSEEVQERRRRATRRRMRDDTPSMLDWIATPDPEDPYRLD